MAKQGMEASNSHLKNLLLVGCGILLLCNLGFNVLLYRKWSEKGNEPARSPETVPGATGNLKRLSEMDAMYATMGKLSRHLEEQKREIKRLQKTVKGAASRLDGISKKLSAKEPDHE